MTVGPTLLLVYTLAPLTELLLPFLCSSTTPVRPSRAISCAFLLLADLPFVRS